MRQPSIVIYDGEVFRPVTSLDLEPGEYRITIEPVAIKEPSKSEETKQGDYYLPDLPPLDDSEMDEESKLGFEVIRSLIGKAPGPPDWSVEHDHCLYSTPKYSELDKQDNQQEK